MSSPATFRFAGAEWSGEQDTLAERISAQLKIKLITARVLVNRGVTSVDAAQTFLAPTLRHALPNPAEIKGIEEAAAILIEAIEAGEEITLFTDFDVDGLSAGAQLFLFLEQIGAKVTHVTPNRFLEGYGLTHTALEKLVKRGTKLLVTVDCGITSEKEIAIANRYGMRVIILDHHVPQTLPPAMAIVNPAQAGCPFQDFRLCAAGLAWMLLVVLRQKLQLLWKEDIEQGKRSIPDPKDFLDLAALGTICDMVPLVTVNRVLASRGLDALRETKKAGLLALKECCGFTAQKKMTAGHVSFLLGPRINAAGRLKDAALAFELLTTADAAKARHLASLISSLNDERRSLEERMRHNAIRMVRNNFPNGAPAALSVFHEDFHVGVIGIVAQRLVEEFYRPSAALAPSEAVVAGERIPVLKGSIRSISGFHVAEALQELSHLCLSHGGHREAGGLTIRPENLENFDRGFTETAARRIDPAAFTRSFVIDAEVELGDVNLALVDELSRLAPFGMGNPSPLLLVKDVTVESFSPFGENNMRLRLSRDGFSVNGVMWRPKDRQRVRKGARVTAAFSPELNSYQGIESVQMNIKELW